ncbi:50S ribosomal protein L1 [Golovinomyces cichoracearum]|uniref:50S ribosomal protein L1 n=1 Tax=Golovinomyces cichoracearum TaxID=62708 RepID=A0A420IBQ9_9PEZI|nr:50S ribosomal protein L1 [Golovinomyces cichoracearum]
MNLLRTITRHRQMAQMKTCINQWRGMYNSYYRVISNVLNVRFLSTSQPLHKGGPKPPRKKKVSPPKDSVASQAKKRKEALKKKKKTRTSYKVDNIDSLPKFCLVDAVRYLQAAEVGQQPKVVKYELAVKLSSLKNGPVVRNRLRLPHPVRTDTRISVICPPESKYAAEAREAGAVLVGEENIFQAVKDGKIEFDRLICQSESLEKMNKAQLGKILGPKGMMPSAKMGTVVKNPAELIRDMIGAVEYREKLGVVRLAIGQLAHSPMELQSNIKAFMTAIKHDMAQIAEKANKTIAEVVLSSTNGPGLTLNGKFQDGNSINPQKLTGTHEMTTEL